MTIRKEKNVKKVRFSYLSFIFLLMISVPLLNNIFCFYSPGKLRENRKTVKKPILKELGLKQYLSNFKKYYSHTFPFRSKLVFLNSYLRVRAFNISPVERVMIGKKGWLFINKLRENSIEVEYSRSNEKFSTHDLELWRRIFDERREWLNSKGIMMFLLLVPNKSTVYPEFLPNRISAVTSQVRTDQLIDYFKRSSKVNIIDLRKEMFSEKGKNRLYYKTDSHWNWFGTYIGYKEIIKYLSKFYKGIKENPFDFFQREKIFFPLGGDLAVMLSLQHSLFKEDFYRLFSKHSINIKRLNLKNFHRRNVNTELTVCKTGKLPKTIMIHDSFGNRLRRMLSPNFSEIIYLRDWGFNIFPELIKREKPKIIIYEIAERFLHNFSLHNPPEIIPD